MQIVSRVSRRITKRNIIATVLASLPLGVLPSVSVLVLIIYNITQPTVVRDAFIESCRFYSIGITFETEQLRNGGLREIKLILFLSVITNNLRRFVLKYYIEV